jgi:hypothetical protein
LAILLLLRIRLSIQNVVRRRQIWRCLTRYLKLWNPLFSIYRF